ncbi:MAG: cytochrome b N-terminal domain-containing protein [Thermodesulfobacteriota bacterium]
MNSSLLLHFRPRRLPEPALRFSLTFGLGGTATLLIMVQFFTGLLLRFAYEPRPVAAFHSVQHISSEMFFGPLIRNLHHWAGHLLIVVIICHFLRIFYQGAYTGKRWGNWLVGLGLGILVCLANFSGYLLPWDQLSYWAVTIATNMLAYLPFVGPALHDSILAGAKVDGATLLLFYNFHTAILPLLLLVAMAYHFWLVRKAGGVSVGERSEGGGPKVPAGPHLFTRELAMAALVLALLMLGAILLDAPLLAMANPELTPEIIRAPWYFVGFQELLLHIPPAAAWVLLIGVTVFCAALPFMVVEQKKSPKVIRLLMGLLLLSYGLLTLLGCFLRGPGMTLILPWH